MHFFLQGFLLGIAYVAPIGMQNLYVINTAIRKPRIRAYQVALITIFFDIALALACFYGMGVLLENSEVLKAVVLCLGSLAVLYIGIQLLKSKPEVSNDVDVDKSLLQITLVCFTVTWMNPQALIDGSLLLGGFRASLPEVASKVFITGVCIASFTWFISVATIVSKFKSKFSGKVIKVINTVCGAIIIYYGLKLGYEFIKMIT